MAYGVFYDAPDGKRSYTLQKMTRRKAEEALALFKARYLNADGTGKTYPNGKGVYPFSNPRIENW